MMENETVLPNCFRITDRWLLADYVFGLFGDFENGDFQTQFCRFSNTFHVNDPPVFCISSRSILTLEIARKIQWVVKVAENIECISIEFDDESLEQYRGCRITAAGILAYEGGEFFVNIASLKQEPSLVRQQEVLSEQVALIQAAPSARTITDVCFWEEIVARINKVSINLPVSHQQQFQIVPYFDQLKAAVLAFNNPVILREELLSYFELVISGLNPWEILITTNESTPQLVYSIFQGGHTRA